MIVAKSNQVALMDQTTIKDYAIPGIVLMEHAAMAVCDVVSKDRKSILVVCGVGNNGGDGFAIARNLIQRGEKVTVLGVGNPLHLKNDAKIMYDSLAHIETGLFWYEVCSEKKLDHLFQNCDVIVDAIFGTGCNREVSEGYLEVIERINKKKAYVISVDIPSGVNSDNGKIMGACVKASLTVTFTLPKLGNILYPGAKASERLKVVDIGIPQKVLEGFVFEYETIDQDTIRRLPSRKTDGHKFTYGKVLIIAGSKDMSGAAYMAAMAAYRTGTGLVEILTHESCRISLQCALPEAIIKTYQDDCESIEKAIETVSQQIESYDAVLIGPGLGQSESAQHLLAFVLLQPYVPIIMDADALNLLSANFDILLESSAPIIMTPHIGEMSRLTKFPTEAINENTVEFAQAFSKSNQVITVLKSHRTVVCNQEGLCCINLCGNDGMATAGSGDVLAGIIASLVGQGIEPFESGVLGVAIHSLSGDLAYRNIGRHGLMAHNIIDAIPKIMMSTDSQNREE
ncbi:NAD(P)H-hydrate dehydratase [Petrocella sp. FN5]|uniref:NAD(P)H-hydrate dehydratase n=1 Tax=Petrocella sp. FN5 TaxID=3032002 RepID=UPI0023D9CBA4|nr:NAD(P)H-hydrate dehydratase [Petrocella sp. FN5]MDF1616549.1 NAD(P)H-hydrate dehydratase [Petrocella sp. FN5]